MNPMRLGFPVSLDGRVSAALEAAHGFVYARWLLKGSNGGPVVLEYQAPPPTTQMPLKTATPKPLSPNPTTEEKPLMKPLPTLFAKGVCHHCCHCGFACGAPSEAVVLIPLDTLGAAVSAKVLLGLVALSPPKAAHAAHRQHSRAATRPRTLR